MTIATGPNIVATGLLFSYDMDSIMSWKGAAVTNQFLVPTPAANGDVTFAIQGTGTFKRIYSGTYGGYTITNNDVVYRYDLGATGCHYHGNQLAVSAGQYLTFVFDYYVSPDAADYPTVNYLANIEGVGGGAATDPTPTQKGVWKQGSVVSSATAAQTYNLLLYPGACNNSYLASSGFILYKNPQILLTTTSNFTAPFVGPTGSRSTTNALLDLTGNRTITINGLTYASNNTFSFNGSTDSLTIPTISLGNGNLNWTVSAWVKTTTTASTLGAGSVMSNANSGPVYSVLGVNSGKIVYWTYQNAAWAQKLGVGTTVNDGNWHMLTWVNNSDSTMAMYVDGVLDSNVANSTSGNNNPIDMIGGSWNAKFAGSIGSTQVYNTALTAQQVAQNFSATRGRYGV